MTTAGVTCGTNCVITSAGLTCPPRGGDVPPQGGEVLPGGPVSGGSERTPTARVKPEREVKEATVTGGQGVDDDTESADTASLPFTGATFLRWLMLAGGLVASGLLVRRLTWSRGSAVEPAGDATQVAAQPGRLPRTTTLLAGQPGRLPRTTKPSFLRAIVLPWLSLVTVSALLRHRIRR